MAAAAALESRLWSGDREELYVEFGDSSVLAVTARTEDVLVTFRWRDYPFTLCVSVPRNIPYAISPNNASFEEWADDATTWLGEELSTGLVARAGRAEFDDVIELMLPGRPHDDRFYLDTVGPEDGVAWDAMAYFEADGFDTTTVRAARANQTLISWVRANVNGRKSGPWVGHAAVVRTDATSAQVLFCEAAPRVPETVTFDLWLQAVHEASWQGAERVWTDADADADDSLLAALGFRNVRGRRELSTRLLDVDLGAYRQALSATQGWRAPRRLRSLFSWGAIRVGS